MKQWVIVLFIFALILGVGSVSAQAEVVENSSLIDRSNDALGSEIAIPYGLQTLARVLFGISEDESITFSFFVMLIASWIILFILLSSFVKLMPFFEGWRVWVASFVIMLLIGISNGLEYVVAFLLWLPLFVDFFDAGEAFVMVVSFIFLFVIYMFLSKTSKYLKNNSKILENERMGMEIHTAQEVAKERIGIAKE